MSDWYVRVTIPAVTLFVCLSLLALPAIAGASTGLKGDTDSVSSPSRTQQITDRTVDLNTDVRSISYGQTVTSTVDTTDQMVLESPIPGRDRAGNWYYEPVTFEGSAGEVIDANLSAPGTGTVLVLRDSSGDKAAVTANDDGAEGAHLVHRLEQDGEYTIRVFGHTPMSTFEYDLSLTRVAHIDSNPESIDVGETVYGDIEETDSVAGGHGGYHDNVTLDVRRGQRISIRLDSAAGSNLWLYSPNGTLLTWDVTSAPGETANVQTELPYGGGYTIAVSGSERPLPFSYRLSVSEARLETVEISEDRLEEREYAEFEVRRATLNTTTRYAGTPFELRATVANVGTVRGTFEANALAGRTQLSSVDDSIGAGQTEEIVLRSQIDQPGNYPIMLDHEYVGQVRALPRPEPSLSVSTLNATTRATINHTRVNSNFDVPLTAVTGTGSDFSRLQVRFDRATRMVTLLARERAIQSERVVDEGRPPLPTGIRPIRMLSLTRRFPGSSSGIATAALEFSIDAGTLTRGAPDVVVYRMRDGGTGWTTVDPTLVSASETGFRFRAPVTGSNAIVLAERSAVFEVTNVSTSQQTVEAGSTVSVTAEVANRGLATASREFTLQFDDRQISTRWVTLAPNGTTSLTFQDSVGEPGRHRVTIGNETTTFEVRSVTETTATPTATPTPVPVTTVAPAAEQTPGQSTPVTSEPPDSDPVAVTELPIVPLMLVIISMIAGSTLVVTGLRDTT